MGAPPLTGTDVPAPPSTGNGAGAGDGGDLAERLRAATELLESVAADRAALDALTTDERVRLLNAAGDVYCPDVEERRQRAKARRRRDRAEKLQRDEEVLGQTGIRRLRAKAVFTTPNVFVPEGFATADTESEAEARGVGDLQHCYTCKQKYTEVDAFYDQLCPPCATLNRFKRTETADLSGRVALLTGGRVKIGYQAGIKLLRAGASLIVTTRFPRDSALRYAQEADFDDWADRLEIFGLDLRHTPSVEDFCHHLLTTRDRLDFIVNNACQTVRRPPDFYRHMMELETASLGAMPEPARALLGQLDGLRGAELVAEAPAELLESTAASVVPDGQERGRRESSAEMSSAGMSSAGMSSAEMSSAEMSQARLLAEEYEPQGHLFPAGRLDQDLQQVDQRDRNSWRLTLAEV
ncbi:MAG TPA: SDR family NAD(P)-dependent oxidoreductase, partial [Acidimicrobiales bacterium]